MENNNSEEIINNLEATLKTYQVGDSDNEKFDLQIKIGDLIEKDGDIDKSLEYFKSAYQTSVILDNKRYQVDALVKITEGCFYKGEVEESIKYAEIVEELLKDTDYVKGKLDISLYLLKVYHIKNEYYKAREIGNQALKLCTEEYIIYKGRILNALAGLYDEISSVDEHLDLLKQSLVCFESGNCLRGTLGVLNNIGVVYSDNLQNNEKALEYFFKLKEQSECSNYCEFNVFAYINIGEEYFKCFKYEKALYWCKLALKKAEEAHLEAMVFYAYVNLTSINLNLNNYKEAFVYFKLAIRELEIYPDQGPRLSWFYKSAANLFLEFGEIPNARQYIQLALDLLGNEQSIIKWNTGIVYEFIKLKCAKDKTEILGSLEGIKYILSKYKNSQVICNIVYDVALGLVDLEQDELAFKLVDEYKEMKVESENIRLKHKYIKALRCNNEEKEQMLNSALKLAVDIKNCKLHLKIASSLGDYYFRLHNYEKTKELYMDVCKQIKSIIISVPEEFRIQYINFNKLLDHYNRLGCVKEEFSTSYMNKYKIYHYISNKDELVEFLEGLDKIIMN